MAPLERNRALYVFTGLMDEDEPDMYFIALVRGMLTIDPNKRMTLNDIRAHVWVMR